MASLCKAVYKASGCKSVTEFISSPLVCHSVQGAYLSDYVSGDEDHALEPGEFPVLQILQFSPQSLRLQEEPDTLPRFLQALPTSIPSCTLLALSGVELSYDELMGLCRGLASPLCTLQSLDFDVRLSFGDRTSAETTRLIGDALSRNRSLQTLTIISGLICSQDRWVPCSVQDLTVKLEENDTLDVLLGLFAGLANNSISVAIITIIGPFIDFSREIDSLDFFRPIMLQSETQLGVLLLTNTSLTAMYLLNLVMPKEAFCLLFSSLNRNPNLRTFSLTGYVPSLPGDIVRMLFAALEMNRGLTSLELCNNCGEDWPNASFVLDSLRINGVLTDVNVDESPLDEYFCDEGFEGLTWEALSAQLERNRENVEQMKAFNSLGLN